MTKHFESLLMSFQTQCPEPKSRFSTHFKNGKSSPGKNNVTVSAFHRITREIGNHDFLYEVCVWPPRARPPLPHLCAVCPLTCLRTRWKHDQDTRYGSRASGASCFSTGTVIAVNRFRTIGCISDRGRPIYQLRHAVRTL